MHLLSPIFPLERNVCEFCLQSWTFLQSMYGLVSEWNLTDPSAVVTDSYQPRVTLRCTEMTGDDYCLLGYGALYSSIKWLQFQKTPLANVYGRISSSFLPEVDCVCPVVMKHPKSASLNAVHPWRWQAIFKVRTLGSSYLRTYRDVRLRETCVVYFSRRKSRGLTKWSCEVLLPFRLVFNDVWNVLHLGLLDIFRFVHVLHFRTAALQSGSIITLVSPT